MTWGEWEKQDRRRDRNHERLTDAGGTALFYGLLILAAIIIGYAV